MTPKKPQYCLHCGARVAARQINCSACGGVGVHPIRVRPKVIPEAELPSFKPPWDDFPWREGGAVLLWGGPGRGKSSIAAQTLPQAWVTSEQEPLAVSVMFKRLGIPVPVIYRVKDQNDLREFYREARTTNYEQVVLDSVSALGLSEGRDALLDLVRWAQDTGSRALAIAQVTKAGGFAGYMEIAHEVDAIASVGVDKTGLRYLAFEKSRFSSLDTRYWIFTDAGTVDVPDFTDDVYSVEGHPGSYQLVPFPVPGCKWSGALELLSGAGLLDGMKGRATVGVEALHKATRLVLPNDWRERKSFAERHGLSWLNLEEINQLLEENEDAASP